METARDQVDDGVATDLVANSGVRWHPWQAFAALVTALLAITVAIGVLGSIFGIESRAEETTSFRVFATLVQEALLLAFAYLFAQITGPVRAADFGLRGGRLAMIAKRTAAVAALYYAFALTYAAALRPDIEQTVAQDLGARDGLGGLLVAAFLIVVAAPIVEELFFRGFFYRALRGRFSVAIAAPIDGLVFGLLHWNFASADQLLVVPPLAVFGALLCLLYERTGTLLAPIALHAFNNTLALSTQAPHDAVTFAIGALMLVVALTAARVVPSAPESPTGVRSAGTSDEGRV
ncbi:CPBP family intramembrane glutamic endopeptidase [Thermoleophilum album]|uniref:CAAX prenyl protease 2/Lysostaphin resistance protein A-like domain-containing protein n=1 Tax=Thermoleophilum album TaxID=29539 RepID=A0A1H6FMD3_THEAL|nr:type II CAAX endopeptidase family protein [Thermoleophilum album]SEH11268.1 hypothetical protein SAMN02745716_0712 [Thermoleophilum album]